MDHGDLRFRWRSAGRADGIAAVYAGSHTVTYSLLRSYVDEVASYLAPYSGCIAIAYDRSLEALITALACLQCDNIWFTPITDRCDDVLRETDPILVVAPADFFVPNSYTRATIEFIDDQVLIVSDPITKQFAANDDRCCCLFTSGSGSVPKRAIIRWTALSNRLRWMWTTYPFQPGSRLAWTTSITFVDSLWQIFGAVLTGATVVIIPATTCRDLRLLNRTIIDLKVTHLVSIPSVARGLVSGCWSDPAQRPVDLQQIVCSGEPLETTLAIQLRCLFPSTILLNLYGCTEAMGDSLVFEWSRSSIVNWTEPICPIGYPIPGNTITFDTDNQIVISGQQVCAGPVATGDIGRCDGKGLYHYVGRANRCIKRNGQWVSLDQIESRLHSHGRVCQAVVVHENHDVLVGVVHAPSMTTAELRAYCATTLRPFEIPDQWIVVGGALPRTPSWKPDIPKICQMVSVSADPRHRASTVAILGDVLCKTLGVDAIGEHDPILDRYGLDSLRATLAFGVICQRLGLDSALLRPAHLATFPTLAALATFAETQMKASPLPRKRHKPSRDIAGAAKLVAFWSVDTGSCVDTGPVLLSDSLLVAVSHSGAVVAIALHSGFVIFTNTLPSRIETSPMIFRNRIVVCCRNSTVYGLDREDGAVRWQVVLPDQVRAVPVAIDDRRLALSCYSGSLCIVSISDDEVAVSEEIDGKGPLRSAPAFDQASDMLVIASLKGIVYGYSLATSEHCWSYPVGCPVFADPTLSGDHVYILTARGDVFCLCLRDGRPISYIFLDAQIFATPTISNDLILIATQNRGLFCYSLSLKECHWVWHPYGVQYCSPAVVLDCLIYICSTSGRIEVLRLSKTVPELLTFYQLSDESFATPVVHDDFLLIGCRDDHIHCLRLQS